MNPVTLELLLHLCLVVYDRKWWWFEFYHISQLASLSRCSWWVIHTRRGQRGCHSPVEPRRRKRRGSDDDVHLMVHNKMNMMSMWVHDGVGAPAPVLLLQSTANEIIHLSVVSVRMKFARPLLVSPSVRYVVGTFILDGWMSREGRIVQ